MAGGWPSSRTGSCCGGIDGRSLLEQIDDPATLRKLERSALPQLARELRAYVINTVAQTGGHLSSNLGIIELTIALHYVYDTPRDRIVWDVGHQTYAHKMLTGRRAAMQHACGRPAGLSGFPRRSESVYDTFGTGALVARRSRRRWAWRSPRERQGEERKVVAVIGDGAMSAGMAFEALNNAGTSGADLLVILNDNEMSISRTWARSTATSPAPHLAPLQLDARAAARKCSPSCRRRRSSPSAPRSTSRAWSLPGTLFEELGFNYIGPIDGHDLDVLMATLAQRARARRAAAAARGHAQGQRLRAAPRTTRSSTTACRSFDPAGGIVAKPRGAAPTYTQIFGDWLCDMAATRHRAWSASPPAMREGSGLVRFAQEYPERFFDVGIAEQHAVTFAAGLACEGMKPVVAIYSTFLQRAYDQLIHDVALQNLPVVFAIDRAGLVGADGPTHHGAFDLSYLRCLPNMTVMAPADENECRQMLYTGTSRWTRRPRCATRAATGRVLRSTAAMTALPIGRGEVRRESRRRSQRIALLAFGSVVRQALAAGEELDATVANMRFVKPLDTELVARLAREHDGAGDRRGKRGDGRRGQRGGRGAGRGRHRHPDPAPGLAGPLPRPRRSGAAACADCGLDARGIVCRGAGPLRRAAPGSGREAGGISTGATSANIAP